MTTKRDTCAYLERMKDYADELIGIAKIYDSSRSKSVALMYAIHAMRESLAVRVKTAEPELRRQAQDIETRAVAHCYEALKDYHRTGGRKA